LSDPAPEKILQHPRFLLMIKRFSFLLLAFFLLFTQLVWGEEPFAFVVVGDAGCGCKEQIAVAQRMIEWHKEKPYHYVLMTGDNIYGEDFFRKSFSVRKRGGDPGLFASRFDSVYGRLLGKGVKFLASLGNHDVETKDGRYEIKDKKRFNILGDKGYYVTKPESQKEDLITFFALNSTRFMKEEDDEQVQWLSRELAASQSKWKIVFFHHPIYTPPGKHEPEALFLKAIENILVAGGVKITFAGHNHFYARIKPQKGITHFVSGGGGRYLKTPEKSTITEVTAKAYHFLYVEIYPDRIDFWAIPPTGPPLDQGTIRQ